MYKERMDIPMNKKITSLLTLLVFAVSMFPASTAAAAPGGLTAEEQAVLNLLDYDHAWNQLEVLSTLPEKVSGTPQEAAAQEYVYQQFKQMGLTDVVKQTFPSQSWTHEGESLKIVTPLNESIPVTAYGGGYSIWGTENGKPYVFGNRNSGKTLVAPVVSVGFGTAGDFESAGDVQGRIVLVRRDDDVTLWPSVVLEEAAAHGASAVIFYGYYGSHPQVDTAFGDATLPDSIKQDTVGGPLPAISISINSAVRIKELLAQGAVTLQIDGRADIISERQGRSTNVTAVMRGSKYPDEYVVFSTHIDTWWTGTLDTLCGVAAVLEYARLFSQAKAMGVFDNERTLVFAVVGSEEFGGPQGTWFNWLVGSYEYVKSHPEVVNKTVVDLNLDMLSLKKSSGKYWIEQSPEANAFVADALSDLSLTGMVGFYNPIYSWVDGWSFYAKGGVTSMNVLWVANADQIYHTQLDTMEYADPEPLKISLDLYTLLAIRADHALVLPFDLSGTVDWASASLASDKALAPSENAYFASASTALDELREQVTLINAYADGLRESHAKATENEKALIEARASALNQKLFEARKVINVWSLGEGGTAGSWDVFLRTHQHAHDISYLNSAVSTLQRGRTANALKALESVYSMEWGHRFSRTAYLSVMNGMMQTDMYWGAEWDQQQEYVDVQGIYLGLKYGQITATNAKSSLENIKSQQLIPWLREDLSVLESALYQSANILNSGLP